MLKRKEVRKSNLIMSSYRFKKKISNKSILEFKRKFKLHSIVHSLQILQISDILFIFYILCAFTRNVCMVSLSRRLEKCIRFKSSLPYNFKKGLKCSKNLNSKKKEISDRW
jgi:hypothetical protein